MFDIVFDTKNNKTQQKAVKNRHGSEEIETCKATQS